MTLRDWLADTVGCLSEAGVDSPAHDARVLASHVLGLSLSEVSLSAGRELLAGELARLAELVTRRTAREPLQYVVGDTEFFGRVFRCDPRALVPRPDTETLVEIAIDLVGATGAVHVVDVGTGTGVIALTVALELPDVQVLATDISADALALAAENAALHDLEGRVQFAQGDCLAALGADWRERAQVVVSNPPYVRADEMSGLQPEITDHEPRAALLGESADGTGIYSRIATGCAELPSLRAVAFEVGADQARAVSRILEASWPGCNAAISRDMGGVERVVSAELPGVDQR